MSWMHALGIAMQLAVLGLALFATGCSGRGESDRARRDRDDEDPSPRPSASTGYEAMEQVRGGTISGTVVWSGERPEPIAIPVEQHAEVCGPSQPAPVLELGRRGGVAGTVVSLERIARGRALEVPAQPVEVRIEGCVLRPHVLAVPVGARVSWVNQDGVLHNVRAGIWRGPQASEEPWISEGLPERGARYERAIERPGIVRVVDDAGHPWALGWIHAFEHPYFAVTDADGRFQLTGIPPGQYVVRAWHEGVRATGETRAGRPVYSAPIELTRPVSVGIGQDTPVDFVIDPAAVAAAGE